MTVVSAVTAHKHIIHFFSEETFQQQVVWSELCCCCLEWVRSCCRVTQTAESPTDHDVMVENVLSVRNAAKNTWSWLLRSSRPSGAPRYSPLSLPLSLTPAHPPPFCSTALSVYECTDCFISQRPALHQSHNCVKNRGSPLHGLSFPWQLTIRREGNTRGRKKDENERMAVLFLDLWLNY